MLIPAHMLQEALDRLDHVLAGRVLARMPVEGEMPDWASSRLPPAATPACRFSMSAAR